MTEITTEQRNDYTRQLLDSIAQVARLIDEAKLAQKGYAAKIAGHRARINEVADVLRLGYAGPEQVSLFAGEAGEGGEL
ncbi:MAG: hypothetical protein KAT00_12830 [Planctomycetes bacterium]|nr:hypothetical protein [Planctomycetota bacterium]